MIRARMALVAGALAILTGCGSDEARQSPTEKALEEVQGPGGERVAASSVRARDCLLAVWEAREKEGDFGGDEERAFDRDHDAATGGAISCALGTSASQFEKTLTALRDGATNADRAALLAQAGIPLLYIDKDGAIQRLEDAAALEQAFETVFTTATLEKLRTIALDQMTVVPEKGGFFDLGALWLVVPETGARPQLVTVNDQSAAEAAALRAKAKAREIANDE